MVKIVIGVLLALTLCHESGAQSLARPGSSDRFQAREVVVIGFVGGLHRADDATQGVVQISGRLRQIDCAELRVHSYSHFHWRSVYKNLIRDIDSDRDGRLSAEELRQAPKIIIFGHSLGGWAVVKLARRLDKAHVPVELTVQMDTVGIGDTVVPRNVKFAMNYYQRTQWPLRGEKRIRAENAGATHIIDNQLIRNVGHEALATQAQISDFITDRVRAFCLNRNASRALACNPQSPH